MELTPFVKANLSSSVKQYLYEYIRQEDKAGRTKLLPEEKLAQKMGVRRVTIRRALDELERVVKRSANVRFTFTTCTRSR